MNTYYVYILASLSGTLYVGLTDDLRRRVEQHKLGLVDGFTKKYKVNRLMYFEIFRDAEAAEGREKQLKKWRREKKMALFAKSTTLGGFEQTSAEIGEGTIDVRGFRR